MLLSQIDATIEQAESLIAQERHGEALGLLEGISRLVPNSPVMSELRIRTLAGLGRADEALHECEKLAHRLDQIRQMESLLDDLLDIDQASYIADLVLSHNQEVGQLKSMLERRRMDSVEKESMQQTIAQLQKRLEQILHQRESDAQNQQQLIEELNRLRQQQQEREAELEQAHRELDELKHTLVERESEIAAAEIELSEREKRLESLESEVASLEQRSASAMASQQELNAELERLRAQGDQKNLELQQAREALEALQRQLAEREQAVEEAQQRVAEREQELARMRSELDALRGESQKAAEMREALEEELDQLRQNEREKSEALENAREELARLQSALAEREAAVAAAEARARESEQAMAALREEFDRLKREAEEAAASEQALAQELAALRENERSKTQALENTRAEMERLAHELAEKEARLREESTRSATTTEAARQLERELEELRSQADHFAQSEQQLVQELDFLRMSESEKTRVLENAREEMERLRAQLTDQERAMADAARASREHDEEFERLRAELNALREQAHLASSSEEELAREVAQLRENEAAKSEALAAAQAELEALKQRLAEQEQNARSAEAENAERVREMEALQQELNSLKNQAVVARDAESSLLEELDTLRRSEEEKNRAIEESRKEVEALRRALEEREEAAARAAREQEESRRIIRELEAELAALRNRELESVTSQQVLEQEAKQVASRAGSEDRDADTVDQLKALKDALDQLKETQKAQFEKQKELQRQAALAGAFEDSESSTNIPPIQIGQEAPSSPGAIPALGARQGLEAAMSQPSARNALEAFTRALQQRSQSQASPAPAAHPTPPATTGAPGPQTSRQQTDTSMKMPSSGREVLEKALSHPSSSGGRMPAMDAAMKQASGSGRSVLESILGQPSGGARPAATPQQGPSIPLTGAKTRPEPVSRPTTPAPSPAEEDDDALPEDDYPKPRDVGFIFANQSVSVAAPRKRSTAPFIIAAVLLALIATAGIAAFILQGGKVAAPVAQENAQPPKEEKKPEVKILSFPADWSVGTLYDHNTPHTSDADWPPFAEARGQVEAPLSARFHLVVRKEMTNDLAFLNQLAPDDIYSLWLPSITINDQNLSAIKHLEKLAVLYIDQELGEDQLKQIREAIASSTFVNSRSADMVVRDLNPPGERVFTLPENAVGYVDVRPWQMANAEWQRLAIAKGEIRIPAGMEVRLEISQEVPDAEFLRKLDPAAIHTLVLKGGAIRDELMDAVVTLRGLLALDIQRTLITDEGFSKIKAIKGLQELRLEKTRVTDAGIAALDGMIQLRRVEIIGAPGVTAKSFPVFQKLLTLNRLHLGGCSLSPDEVAQLRKMLPNCAITTS